MRDLSSAMPASQIADVSGLAAVVFRHKWKAISVFTVSVLVSLAYIVFAPRTYESSAKLFMRVGRESVALDPTATIGQTMMVEKTQESEINSALEILSSRGVAAKVVQMVGPEEVLEQGASPGWVSRLKSEAVGFVKSVLDSSQPPVDDGGGAQGGGVSERAIIKILKSTQVSAPKESMILSIRSRAGSPALAQRLCQVTTDVFLDEYVRVNHTAGSHQFFREQTEKIRAELSAAQRELRDRKNAYGLITVSGKQQILEQRLREVELTALQTARLIAAARTKIEELDATLPDVPKEVVTQFEMGYPNEARNVMRAKLYELEIGEAQQSLGAQHPLAGALKSQREKAQAILTAETRERTQETRGLNPVHVALETERLTQHTELASLEAQDLILTEQLARLSVDLSELNDQQFEIDRLEREVQRLETSYSTHLESLELARIDAELESQRISNINVLQPATYISKPVKPAKSFVLLAAMVLGACGAAGLVFACEYFDLSVRTVEQLEAALRLPVLLVIERKARSPVSLGYQQLEGSPSGR
jgi:uncharacterized protein involved in exopolysaccharide biosynthesis